ncbi:hypothetical protein FVEG_15528 [Fusarium verticillioides 7600]|uniref:Uncharacterized protein n=1 Tax=Gibberella moniliformis (strain M3125 / FGSC 7600) TaxID=334819 RepID=W7M6I4_GIBM7|nr:hypothetical protein FVEG_15528 [Fusarium verticillioides 7600]EWG43079.1 hypothetical protein FVEG_15528 [Fusarium verticillioides 7600]
MIVYLFWRVLRSILRTCWDWACLLSLIRGVFSQSLRASRASMAQRLMNGNYMSIMLASLASQQMTLLTRDNVSNLRQN